MFVLLTALAVAGGDCFAATQPFAGRTDAILAATFQLGQTQTKQPAPGKDALGDPLPAGAIARLGTARLRSAGFKFALSADGKTIFTAASGIIGRVDAETGRLVDETEIPTNGESGTWFSPNGKLVAMNRPGDKGSLEVWDTAAHKRLQVFPVRPGHVAFALDGKTLASTEYTKEDGRIRLWDIATGKDRALAQLPSYANDIVFSPDGKRLFAAVDNHSLRCWDCETGRQIWQNGHWAGHVAIAADGKVLCSDKYLGGPLYLWDADTGAHLGQLGGDKDWTMQIAFAPDGKSVAQGSGDTLLWDVATKKLRHRFEGAGPFVAFAADSRSLFTMGSSVLRWDAATGNLLYDDSRNQGHIGPVVSLAYAPDGRSLASIGADKTLRVWSILDKTHRTLHAGMGVTRTVPLGDRFLSGKQGPLTFTPDGQHLVLDIAEGVLCLIGVTAGKEIRRFELPSLQEKRSPVRLAATQLTPDGRHLIALGESPFNFGIQLEGSPVPLRVWELATGKEVLARTLMASQLELAEFSPDGRLVVLGWGRRVYNVKTGGVLSPAWPGQYLPLAFSGDSRLVAGTERENYFGSAKAIQVFEVQTGQQLARMELPLGWHPVRTLSADGRFLAVAGSDALYVWETSTGKRLIHLPAKGRSVPLTLDGFASCMAFSPDGKSLATGHADGTIMLWDMTPAWQNLTVPVGPIDVAACWEALAERDPLKAYAAIDALVSASDKALLFLRQKLAPVKVDRQWLADRLAELNSDKFAVREQASRELEKVAEAVENDLRKLLEKPPSQEVRNRLVGILKTLEAAQVALPPIAVRELRALTVLERIGTKEAQALLRDLAAGSPDARLTQDAAAALGRLKMSRGD